jgi:hypothetical protein
MQRIEEYPLASPLVTMSLATEISEGAVSKILVDLVSLVVLAPTATAYFISNDLLPEVLSRAGLPETTTYATLTQLTYVVDGDCHRYRLQMTISAA